MTGHQQSSEATSVEIAPGVYVNLCTECCKEAQDTDEALSQENAGDTLVDLLPVAPPFAALAWENGR